MRQAFEPRGPINARFLGICVRSLNELVSLLRHGGFITDLQTIDMEMVTEAIHNSFKEITVVDSGNHSRVLGKLKIIPGSSYVAPEGFEWRSAVLADVPYLATGLPLSELRKIPRFTQA